MVQKLRTERPPKRRGRPRAYDPQVALARAAAVFWKAGYAGTSLDDLVAATGMNRPSLYAAFGDKRDSISRRSNTIATRAVRWRVRRSPTSRSCACSSSASTTRRSTSISRAGRAAAFRSALPQPSRRSMTTCGRFLPTACARPIAS